MIKLKFPTVYNVDTKNVSNVIKAIASRIGAMSNTKSIKISFQRITTDGIIHTCGAELLNSGVQKIDEFIIPFCKNAKEYRPIMLELLNKGFTQKKIAELLNLSASTVSRTINGK